MKKLITLLILLLNIIGVVQKSKAVNEAALLFLLIQPSISANGMAGASVATSKHDALSVAFNPAHIGLATFERSFNFEFFPIKTKWLPQFNIDNLTFDAKSVLIGYDLRKLKKNIPISIGAGYTRIFMNLGEQVFTDERGETIWTFNSFENADIWSIGIGVDYFVKVGFGLNFKNIDSNLFQVGAGTEKDTGPGSANAHDFGLLVEFPVIETYSKLTNKQFKIGSGFYPFLKTGYGFSKSNIGDEIIYLDAAQSDPLPRVARMGFSINAGFSYSYKNIDLCILSFEWSSEAEDLLVKRDVNREFSYESGLGEIDFFENVIKANPSENVINSRGWELSLNDVFFIRNGRYEDPDGKVLYSTAGFGISFVGLLKFIGFINPELMNHGFFRFLTQHGDIQFNHSSFDAKDSPLDDTNFNGIKISFF